MPKINDVVYYKQHSKGELRHTKGTLVLNPESVSFESEDLCYCWNLDSIEVGKIDGMDNSGMKIIGTTGEEDERSFRHTVDTAHEDEEYLFANVENNFYNMIRFAVYGDDEETIETSDGESCLALKSVRYYKVHHRTAVPTRGKLLLAKNTISFRGKGYDYRWYLSSIVVEKFKGRISMGMKILGKRQAEEGDMEEYTFTHVNQHFLDKVQRYIEEAK